MTDRQEFARAYDQGQRARSAGKPAGTNPYLSKLARVLFERWQQGWSDRDRELQK